MSQKIAKDQVWVIVPSFNEEKYLGDVLRKLQKETGNIIVVDDGSSDSSSEIAKKHTPHVLIHRVNLGKGAALKTGSEFAFTELTAQAVVFLDADDQHDPQELSKFIEKLQNGAEVVFGARKIDKKMPVLRTLGNTFASKMIQFFFGAYIPDIPSGYKSISKAAYDQVKWESANYAVEMEIAARVAKNHVPFAVVPIQTIYLDYNRGMTMLDVFGMVGQIINWKFSL